jgi:superfamily I DNA/RNA helicase
LIALCKRWKTDNVWHLKDKLDAHKEKEVAKFRARGKEREIEAITDKVETIKVIIGTLQKGASVRQLEEVIRTLFDDTLIGDRPKHLTLSTIHKAKGREWPTVYLWGRNAYMPSKYAKQQWELDQEENLIYVGVTRAQEKLVEVTVDA